MVFGDSEGVQETKPAIKSVSVAGSVTTIVAAIVAYVSAKTHLSPDLVSAIVTPIIVSGAGGIISLIGRFMAKQQITLS